jgi:hypothetical protein
MFAPKNSASVREMTNILNVYFPTRAPASACAGADLLPGKAMHIRALCSGLKSVRSSLLYVKNQLEWNEQWDVVQDTVARELTTASMYLGGILDGCVIVDLPIHRPPTKTMSFSRTPFESANLRAIQDEVNSLRSMAVAEQDIQASLWTVINFWKHYLPYQPLPIKFVRDRMQPLRDFQLVLSGDGNALSGPIVHDLLIPAFNAACRITAKLLTLHEVSGEHNVPTISST